MKFRFSLRALLVLVAVVVLFGYWRSRPAAIARQFEQAFVARDYSAADAHFAPSVKLSLAKWSAAAQAMKAKVAFEEQSWSDWLRGRRAGQLHVGRTFERFAVGHEMGIVATASGIQVISPREGRNDFPTFGESAADWARDAGVMIAELAKFALNRRQ